LTEVAEAITPPRSFAPTLPLKVRVASADFRFGDLDAEFFEADMTLLAVANL